jgi:hypothetical protein
MAEAYIVLVILVAILAPVGREAWGFRRWWRSIRKTQRASRARFESARYPSHSD